MTVQQQSNPVAVTADEALLYSAAGIQFSIPFAAERRTITVNGRRVDVFGAVGLPFSMSVIRRKSPFTGDLAQPGLCGLIIHGWRRRWGAVNQEARQYRVGSGGKAVVRQFDSTSAERHRIWVMVIDDGQDLLLVVEAMASIAGGLRGGVSSWVHEFIHSMAPAE